MTGRPLPLFDTGRTVVTSGANQLVIDHLGPGRRGVAWIMDAVHRHAAGDYGLVDDEDRRANDLDAARGNRVMSAYEVPCPDRCNVTSHRVWVITDPGHTRTTVLLPDEY